MLQWQRNLHLGLHLHMAMGVAEVVMVAVGTGAETVTEMEALVLTGIIMVGSARALTEEHHRLTIYVLNCDLRELCLPLIRKVVCKLET